MHRIPGDENIVIGDDMSGHIGRDILDYDRVYERRYGFGERNDVGVLDLS